MAEPEGFTMTPMIDIVFQLIIFFMLLVDMQRQQLAAVTLPESRYAEEAERAEEHALIVNVLPDGRYKIGAAIHDRGSIIALFRERRSRSELADPADPRYVRYPLIVRCDGSASYENIQWLMMAAAKEGGVAKLRIGAEKIER